MKKSFIECPYGCMDEGNPKKLTVSGSSMHVKVKHPDKYEEFKKNFADIKSKAVIMDTATRTPAAPGPEPPKIDDQVKHGDIHEDKKEPPVIQAGGDDKPSKEASFLKWLDSPDF